MRVRMCLCEIEGERFSIRIMFDYEKELPIASSLQDNITIQYRDLISFLSLKNNMMSEEDWDIGNTSYISALSKQLLLVRVVKNRMITDISADLGFSS